MLIRPKPLPRTMLEGRPKFTMLKMLKNSARNSRVPRFAAGAVAERVFDQSDVEVVEARSAESAAAERAEAPWFGPVPSGRLIGMLKNVALLSPRPSVAAHGAAGGSAVG